MTRIWTRGATFLRHSVGMFAFLRLAFSSRFFLMRVFGWRTMRFLRHVPLFFVFCDQPKNFVPRVTGFKAVSLGDSGVNF